MKKIIFAALIIGSSLMAQMATAQTRTPYINGRQEHQQDRIRQGMRSGELTRGEANHLERREARIRYDKRMAKSDGYVSRGERQHLIREENRTGRAIYRDRHNNRGRM